MSTVQFVKHYFEKHWSEDVSQRTVDVPKPDFVIEKESTAERLEYVDVVKVADGGTQTIEPAELGWNSERVVTPVVLDIRVADTNRPDTMGAIGSPGRTRMFGYRDTMTMEAERYGGVVGEIRRIAHTMRKGTAEFDMVGTPEVNDISAQVGKNYYRVEVTLRLTTLNAPVDPEI